MNATATAMLVLCLLIALLAWTAVRFQELRQSYYVGVDIWSQWLPVLALSSYFAVLFTNLAFGINTRGSGSLAGFFSVPEMLVLGAVSPLFLTGMGNLVATATLVYTLERLLLGAKLGTTPSLDLLMGALTVLAVLADKMPWTTQRQRYAGRLREVLLFMLTLAALVAIFAALVKAQSFSRWILVAWGCSLSATTIMGALIALFLGWLSVAMGFTRHFTLPLLALPTLIVAAFVTSWPTHLLVTPFALCVALSLTTADRRLSEVRRTFGPTPPLAH